MLIPHEPVAYVSNLIPLMHAHFVISTLERAGAEARALKRVAPGGGADEVMAPGDAAAADEAPKRAAPVDAVSEEVTGLDAPAPDAGALPGDANAEPPKPAPLGATPAGRLYCGLICLCLFFWTLAMGFFYMGHSPIFYFVSEVLEIKSSCTWKDKETNTWQERACDRPCEEIPGCGEGWCSDGTCVKSTSDDRCDGKEDRFLGYGEYCSGGLRVHQCVEDKCDPPCEEIPGCDQPDHVACREGTCYTGTLDDRCDDKEDWFDLGDGGWCMAGRRDQECVDEDRIGCYNKWPDYPGNHSYDTFTNSGKCGRMKDWAVRAHNLDVGTVADIDECWTTCQDRNEDGRTSYCASMHQTTMECSCQGADLDGDFDELECLEDVGEYALAVHKDWRGSRCYGNDGRACGCDGGDYCLPYGACCVEHSFHATGEVANTTCYSGRSPWEPETFSWYCTAGHSDAGAVAPAYRNCSQAAIDAGSCGTGNWDTCAECVDENITRGTYFATVGYTSCPPWVVDAIHEDAADGGECSWAWTKRTDVWAHGYPTACSYQLWKDLTMIDGWELRPWLTIMGVFALLSLVCLPFILSFMALPTLAERAGRRVISVWRPTVAWILLGFVLAGIYAFIFLQSAFKTTLFSRADLGPSILGGGLMVMGYATAVVTEERVKVGLYCSVVIFLTFHVTGAIARIVLGCAAVAFAPRRGEREKIRSAVFTTKASVAADRGRLPRWACAVYFCATCTFIVLASRPGMFSTDSSSCSPCNCKENTLIDCYKDARTFVWRQSSWNGIESYLPWKLRLKHKGIKAIEPGAFKDMAGLEGEPPPEDGEKDRRAVLLLKRNSISIIEPYTFAGLRKLWGLSLEKNKIHIVKSNAFLGLHRLNWLELNNNQIQTLEAGAFLGLHNLHNLRLYTNNINRIENGTFAGLDSLRWIELEWNQINNIEDGAFAGLASLRGVDLRGNPVTCLDAYAAGLPQSVECQGFSS